MLQVPRNPGQGAHARDPVQIGRRRFERMGIRPRPVQVGPIWDRVANVDPDTKANGAILAVGCHLELGPAVTLIAQRTAPSMLSNTMTNESPPVYTILPPCSSIAGSIISSRRALRRCSVPASANQIRRRAVAYVSAYITAASFRRSRGSPVGSDAWVNGTVRPCKQSFIDRQRVYHCKLANARPRMGRKPTPAGIGGVQEPCPAAKVGRMRSSRPVPATMRGNVGDRLSASAKWRWCRAEAACPSNPRTIRRGHPAIAARTPRFQDM
jgi:hypothetical protein